MVTELCDLLPAAIRPEQVMRKVAAIAIRNGRENVTAITRTFQNDLCDPRKISSDGVGIFRIRRAQLVKIDLLKKVQVSLGPFTVPWEPSVIDSGSVGVPCGAATRRRVLDMGDRIRQRVASRGLVKVKGAVLASALGKRHRDILAVQ